VFTILHVLYLSYNSIGAEDKSFEDYLELFKLISNTFLITLDLSYNNISQIGIEALIKALPSTTITTLYIGGNCANDEQKIVLRQILDVNRIKYEEQFWFPWRHLSFRFSDLNLHDIIMTSLLCQSSLSKFVPLHIWIYIFSFWKRKDFYLESDDDDFNDNFDDDFNDNFVNQEIEIEEDFEEDEAEEDAETDDE
jgi:hypothetical protein